MRYNPLALIAKMFSSNYGGDNNATAVNITHDERLKAYDLLWSYYVNNVYNRTLYGGNLDYINSTLGLAASQDLYGLVNPVEQVIELYAQNTFAGQYGKDFYVDDKVRNGKNEKPVNPKIIEPIDKIMAWSNFNEQKDRFARLTALFGNSGIRVVVKVGANYPNDDVSERRVYLQFEHAALIKDYNLDGRDNVTEILTEHKMEEGSLSFDNTIKKETHVYKVLMNKQSFETQKDNKPVNITGLTEPTVINDTSDETKTTEQIQGSFSNLVNVMGFVPYVIASFRKHDTKWSAWAFMGSEGVIDRMNALSSHIDKQIFRHVNITWVLTTNGTPPKEFNFSGNRVLVITRKPAMDGASNDTDIKPLIANLDLSGALNKLKFNGNELSDRLPELKAVKGEFLSGQSGETIAQLRKPAEDKLLAFRGNAESAIKRATQMALSYGVLLGLWNLGTGTGTVEAANLAYRNGEMNFQFNERAALSITQQEKLAVKLSEIGVKQAEQDLDQSKQDLINSKQDQGQEDVLNANQLI